MKNTENINKTSENGDKTVAGIFFVYMSIVILGLVYIVCCNDSYRLLRGHTAKSEVTGEEFGTVKAISKGIDGHCEYRACNNEICDWYDNNNNECNGMNKGEWVAVYKNKIYKGTSLCSETKGKIYATPQWEISTNQGNNCWCKTSAGWVFAFPTENTQSCYEGCAGNCAHGALYSDEFRSALSKKLQKTK